MHNAQIYLFEIDSQSPQATFAVVLAGVLGVGIESHVCAFLARVVISTLSHTLHVTSCHVHPRLTTGTGSAKGIHLLTKHTNLRG